MPGMLTFKELQQAVGAGEIDTVIACFPDMQGRLVGKRFQAEFFLGGAHEETHGCDYLLANDIDMEPVPGYAVANWEKGYGDFVMKPDLATLRRIPWLPATALVLCDILDHHSHEALAHAPRTMLRNQIARLEALGMASYFASELEFYLFDETYDSVEAKGWRDLKTTGSYIQDYHILQTTKEESVMRAIRNGLQGAGIPVENSKGEWGPGQEEINVRYADPLTMADWHVILKNGCKEIAYGFGKAVTFMAKWRYDLAGSSSHIHASLWDKAAKTPLFLDAKGEHGMSPLMRQFVAGQLAYAREITWFLAPYINSYKRFQVGTFAPTESDLVARQSHRGIPAVRRRHQGHSHRVPHRRRRPQSLSRLRRADRLGPCRHRAEIGTRAGLCWRRLSRQGAARGAENAAGGHRPDARLEDAARRLRRRGHRPLRAQCGVGAVRV